MAVVNCDRLMSSAWTGPFFLIEHPLILFFHYHSVLFLNKLYSYEKEKE